MTEDPLMARAMFAREVVVEAGRLAMRYFDDVENLNVSHKLTGQDEVSAADRAVERLIRQRIADAFPADGVLGEEEGMLPGSSPFTWVIDPIDGTSCFVRGLSDWCISIALLDGNEIVVGAIDHPVDEELFFAVQGKGALLNGEPITVDGNAQVANGLVGLGANLRVEPQMVSEFVRGLLEAGGMFVRSGSGALMLAHVACGRLAAYYEPHINAWDCMAGLCLIREAGGWIGEFPGPGGLVAGGPVVAAAPHLREEILALIAASEQTP